MYEITKIKDGYKISNGINTAFFKTHEEAFDFAKKEILELKKDVCKECKKRTEFKFDEYYDFVYDKLLTTTLCCINCGWWND